jgi:hypothetical protein
MNLSEKFLKKINAFDLVPEVLLKFSSQTNVQNPCLFGTEIFWEMENQFANVGEL